MKTESHRHYELMTTAIEFLSAEHVQQPSLAEVAAHVGMSEYHLQRTFKAWAGVSPKQFLQYLTKEHAKSVLENTSVMDAAHEVGLSGSGRLHDLLVTFEGVTPGEYKTHGETLTINYGMASCPFGYVFIASTERGICKLSFFDVALEFQSFVHELKQTWSKASFKHDDAVAHQLATHIFHHNQDGKSLPVFVKGTAFQMQVWQALLRLPEGSLTSYQNIAEFIQKPTAFRAVASAIAKNPVGYLIPCHRVIRSTGVFNQYRWGAERKRMMLGRELIREPKPKGLSH